MSANDRQANGTESLMRKNSILSEAKRCEADGNRIRAGVRHSLSVECPVDADGKFTPNMVGAPMRSYSVPTPHPTFLHAHLTATHCTAPHQTAL